ncbi:hypothetical protein BH11BAC2_BH11BAC2_05590 [soil metagenome]
MKLEDQLKQSFDHFEPEVDPSVWMKVSAQIPTSVPAPTAAPKGIFSSLGTTGTWVAAVIGTAVVAGLIWLNTNTTEVKSPVPAEMPAAQEVNTPIKEEIPGNTIQNNSQSNFDGTAAQKPAEIPTPEANSKGLRALTRNQTATEDGTKAGSSLIENVITSQGNSPREQKTNLTVSSANPTPVQPQKTTAETTQSKTENNTQPSVENPERTAPLLILSTRGGFAPITITAFINQTDQKADFDFGDGFSSAQVSNVSHRYTTPGTYTVQCKVGNKVLESTVEVIGEISSAFSPNGDGVNDVFTLENEAVSQIDLRIFDRFGKLLYSAKGKELSWDGRVSGGRIAETGTYFYDIFVTTQNGTTYKQKGTINLFR